MAGRRAYGGGSDMAALLQKEGITAHALEALLNSSASSSGSAHAADQFDVSGSSSSMLNFEGACGNAMNQQFYRPAEAEENGYGDADADGCLHLHPGKKRRLTAEKVEFLEKSFELENKLEPERKIQLAKDLGLQPRQVAIWFQNRRARWKTKQLEKDYAALKSSYNALKTDYKNLHKEKEKLKAEVIFLADKLLVKEKEKGGAMEATQLPKSLENNSVSEEVKELSKTQMMMMMMMGSVKQEMDLSSTNSAIFDSDSPRCCIDGSSGQNPSSEPAVSSNGFDLDHSDLSHADEGEEVRGYRQFLKLEADNSDDFEFPVEDQALWFWPNY